MEKKILHVCYCLNNCGLTFGDTSYTVNYDSFTPEALEEIRNDLRNRYKTEAVVIISWQWFE